MSKLGVTIAIGLFLGAFGFLFYIGYTRNKELEAKALRESICRKENTDKILDFVKDCTSSLQVEENAYVVRECDRTAVKNICGL